MSHRSNARFTSDVRSLRQRTQRLAKPAEPQGTSHDAPETRPLGRTTRFRLERVSLLPFVPAALLAYVERRRVRRRTRLGLLALVMTGSVVGAMMALLAVERSRESAAEAAEARGASADSETRNPSTRSPRRGASNGRSGVDRKGSGDRGGDELDSDRESIPSESPARDRRMRHEVHRPVQEPKDGSSAWWW